MSRLLRVAAALAVFPLLAGCSLVGTASVHPQFDSLWYHPRPASNPAKPGPWSGRGWAYVASEVSTGLTVVDLETHQPVKFIQGAGTTHHAHLSRDQRWVFATQRYGKDLMVVDTENNHEAKFLDFQVEGVDDPGPLHMGFSPDGKWAFVTLNKAGAVGVIDAQTAEVSRIISGVGDAPRDIYITPDSRKAFVSLQKAPWVTVIDLETWEVRKINRAQDPEAYARGAGNGMSMTVDGKYVVISNTQENTISVIDTATEKIIKTIAVKSPVNPSPLGTTPYFAVASRSGGSVSFFDTRDWSLIKTVETGSGANVAYWGPDGMVWVSHNGTRYISIIDPATWEVVKEITVVLRPHWILFSPDGEKAYATNWGSQEISVIDVATKEAVDAIKVGANPNGIAIKTNVSRRQALSMVQYAREARDVVEKATALVIPPARNADEQMFFNTCMACHDVGRIIRNNAQGEQWRAIVERMKGHGAQVNDQNEEQILRYLMSGQHRTLQIQTRLQQELSASAGSAGTSN